MENNFFDTSVFEMNREQWWALAPYLWLCFGIAVGTVAAGFRLASCYLRGLSFFVLIPFIAHQVFSLNLPSQSIFGSSLEVNSWLRIVGVILGLFALLSSLFAGSHDEGNHSEWLPLLLTSLLGLSLLPGSRDWAFFFTALETLAICAYIMTAMDTQRERSLEAGLKYLLLGSFASALFLMGVACLYGFSGSLDFEQIREATLQLSSPQLSLAIAGMLLILVSLAFKVALFPFHMWAPDVYQAAPSGAAAFMASATKLSVFAALAISFQANGFFAFAPVKQGLAVFGVLSIIVGSFLALSQRKLRRLLAYSSIVSAGYVSLSLASGFKGMPSVVAFLLFYGLAVICAFAVIEQYILLSPEKNRDDISVSELSGLARSAPLWLSVCFTLALFSMAGIPPLPGFMGKYLILKNLISEKYFVSAAVLLLGSLLGLAYYLRVLVPLYLEAPGEVGTAKKISFAGALAAALCVVLMIYSLFQVGVFETLQ